MYVDDDPNYHHEHGASGAELDDVLTDLGTEYAECPDCGHEGPHPGVAGNSDGKIFQLACTRCYRIFDAP